MIDGLLDSPTNEWKNLTLLLWYLRLNCSHLTFERIEEAINYFWDLLTYSIRLHWSLIKWLSKNITHILTGYRNYQGCIISKWHFQFWITVMLTLQLISMDHPNTNSCYLKETLLLADWLGYYVLKEALGNAALDTC